jgi:hypothetical protein
MNHQESKARREIKNEQQEFSSWTPLSPVLIVCQRPVIVAYEPAQASTGANRNPAGVSRPGHKDFVQNRGVHPLPKAKL